MKERRVTPTPQHKAFREDVIEVLRKHAGHLDAKDMLAFASHLTGQIIAMQDQRTVTREMALEIVMRNIEVGNAEVIDGLNVPLGRS